MVLCQRKKEIAVYRHRAIRLILAKVPVRRFIIFIRLIVYI